MIEFIKQVGIFVGNLIGQILNIKIGNSITFGVLLLIVLIVGISLRVVFGGRGD